MHDAYWMNDTNLYFWLNIPCDVCKAYPSATPKIGNVRNSPNLSTADDYIARQKDQAVLTCFEKGQSYAKPPDSSLQSLQNRKTTT